MKVFTVYWYRLTTHTNPFSEGYVGVTNQPHIRHRTHRLGRWGHSKILAQAFRKYGEANIVREELAVVDTAAEAYELEAVYRPFKEIGWNITNGGGLPPDTTGRKDSLETKLKRNASVRAAKAGKAYPS